MTKLTTALKGPAGEFEINRLVGAFGATAYVVCANAFVYYDVVWLQHPFDVTAYCLAFPTGLAAAVGAIAGAVSLKDRNVATARLTNARADAASRPATEQAAEPAL